MRRKERDRVKIPRARTRQTHQKIPVFGYSKLLRDSPEDCEKRMTKLKKKVDQFGRFEGELSSISLY